MRIALVSDCYPPRMGGIETQVSHLAARLRRQGHAVCVLTVTPGPDEHGVWRLAALRHGPPMNPWAAPALRRAFVGADVVHIHLGVWAPFAQLAADLATAAAIPTVLTWHSLVGASPLTPVVRRRWRRWITAGAVPTAVSREAASQLADALGTALDSTDQISILPNGIDAGRWMPETRSAQTSPVRVASAMRFTARKRPMGLVAMMLHVRTALPGDQRPRLVICGDGPLLTPLRAVVAASSLREWVELPGRLSAQALAQVYRTSNLYVAPARHEAFGIAALEATAAGLPVLGYAGSGVRDIIGPQAQPTGWLVESDRELIALLISLCSRPMQLQQATAKLRSRPQVQHDWSSVTQRSVALYRRAVARTS
ncbi:MAG: glycosyltransferase family 4 protein [Ornithinimicrobium sp.]